MDLVLTEPHGEFAAGEIVRIIGGSGPESVLVTSSEGGATDWVPQNRLATIFKPEVLSSELRAKSPTLGLEYLSPPLLSRLTLGSQRQRSERSRCSPLLRRATHTITSSTDTQSCSPKPAAAAAAELTRSAPPLPRRHRAAPEPTRSPVEAAAEAAAEVSTGELPEASGSAAVTAVAAGFDERLLGHWRESWREKNKHEDIMKKDGVAWPLRKVLLAAKEEMRFSEGEDGSGHRHLCCTPRLPTGWGARMDFDEGSVVSMETFGAKITSTVTYQHLLAPPGRLVVSTRFVVLGGPSGEDRNEYWLNEGKDTLHRVNHSKHGAWEMRLERVKNKVA